MPVRKLQEGEELVGAPPQSSVRPLQQGELTDDLPPSRTGLIPEDIRADVRSAIEDAPTFGGVPVLEFGAEMTPALIGTALGGAVGGLFGGAGALPGAMVGGLVGEFIGQETGVTEQSDVGLALAGAGPAAGRVLAPVTQGVKRLAEKAITSLPPAKAALGRTVIRDSVDTLSSFGARILAQQKGLMRQPAGRLYEAVKRVGAELNPRNSRTLKTMDGLEDELAAFSSFPEIRASLRLIRSVRSTLNQEGVSFKEIIGARKLVGVAVRKAEKALSDAGVKLGSAKLVFKAMADDIDDLAKFGKGVKGRAARVLQIATKRAKLEFSIDDFETAMAKNLKFIPDEKEVILNVNGLRNQLAKMTNPNHPQFNKNFTEALGEDIKLIMKELAVLDKLSKTLSPAGPGSIVVRGIGAKTGSTIAGAALGFGTAGPAGAAVGSLIGASMPEMMTAILLTKPGRAGLRKAAVAGRGQINAEAWQLLGQALAQTLKPSTPEEGSLGFLRDFVGGG